MFTNSKRLALVGLLAAAAPTAILAQTATPPTATTDQMSETPADPSSMQNDMPGTAETMPGTMSPDTGANGLDAPEAEAPAQPVEGQIVMQSENTILANDLIGRRVYSGEGETVGDINDLLVNIDGSVEGVVIGVGGFLGMGEKEVAVEMEAISVSSEPETGNIRLVLSSTREDLEAAPEFKTADEMESDAMSGQPAEPMDGATAPLPAQ
jgi:sporulation protein YlmC with PRC-barrel domain